MYPYNAPGAFVPHSAINLSVKPGSETGQPGSSALTSLDLSMTDGSGSSSYLNQVRNQSPFKYNIKISNRKLCVTNPSNKRGLTKLTTQKKVIIML